MLRRFKRLIIAIGNILYSRRVDSLLQRRFSTQGKEHDFLQRLEEVEMILFKNIIPFWCARVVDSEEGGYTLNHDRDGKWKGKSDKQLVTQARTIWFFSRLTNSRHGSKEHLDLARHGYEFLCERMWDKESGGFYWEIDFTGKTIRKPQKHMYGQAFGLYALSEYASASGDNSARALAQELFSLLEMFAHDQYYGGYKEFLSSDWSSPPEDASNCRNDAGLFMKTYNTHLHLMEAIIRYYKLTGDPVARERLVELIHINSNATVRKNVGACTDRYQRDWTPLGGLNHERVSYGHDLENVWLLIDSCNALGISNGPFLDLYRTLFVYTLTYGFDWRKGGFFFEGPYNRRADKRDKIWWVQAEGLVSALKMYRLTGEGIYYDCFLRTLEWILNYQVDWQHGDWYDKIAKNGKPLGDKAGAWKSPYHNGRAMLECSELLLSLAESKNTSV